jgi:hypothetical protein
VGRPQQFGVADCGEYRHAAAAARVLLAGASACISGSSKLSTFVQNRSISLVLFSKA